MKVLILSDFFLSGQTTHVLELAKQLQILGTEVHIAFGTIHSKLFWSHYTDWLSENKIPFSAREDLFSLISRCRRFKPDLVHSQSSTLFARAQLLASRFNIPYILTCHGLGFNQVRYRHLLLHAGAIIAIGPNVAAEISGLSPKIAIIPNGVDTERFVPPTEGRAPRRNIVYIGRLERKRIEPLRHLAAAHEAVTKKPLKVISNWNPGIPGTVFRP
ncbi:MAG: glycosyltransferase family 4 protein, partial [Firmicutes bacterium]|nr:glycosyltransferase family 4 protein [Bacillota bacterium]